MAEDLSRPYLKETSHQAALVFSKYSASKIDIFKACFAREWLLMKRNSFVYIFKGIQVYSQSHSLYHIAVPILFYSFIYHS